MGWNRQGGGPSAYGGYPTPRSAGQSLGDRFAGTTYGQLAQGNFMGAFNATPYGQIIAALRGGDPLGANNSREYRSAAGEMGPPTAEAQAAGPPQSMGDRVSSFFSNMFNGSGGATGMNEFGPTLGGYGGSPDTPAPPSWGGTDWGSAIANGGLAGLGPINVATRYGHGAQRAADRGVNMVYNTGNMGYTGTLNPLLGAYVSSGIGGAQMNSPWRQSGMTFRPLQIET